ncbi:MAG: esterase [Winogradskyella sp.]|uniref:alpha/beta hydrolase n=1 Tax=Winogradskyella sp. TaxID=1883156 RepID=UPI0025CEE33A|nr:alpha/beta hydrolase-fold protein [Winogradskyella sp.]NRB60668.1 esterase [Winogradskyella sp.]
MKKVILPFVMFFVCITAINAQVLYKELKSYKTNTARQLKIKLPKNYDEDSQVKHPLIIVFDGDYLFEPVVGQVEFQTYFDDMPGSIVVGVMQGGDRYYDSYVNEVTGLPEESGLDFYNFVESELIPYIDGLYNTSDFRVVVGHNAMAGFSNAFLMRENPIFQAYVNLSPDFLGNITESISKRFSWIEKDYIYYMATSDKDIVPIRESVLATNTALKSIGNEKFTYYFDDFEDETHYTLVTSGISRAFDKIFNLYKPLNEKEIKEKVIPYEGTLDQYLIERYKSIDDMFGIDKPIPLEEFEKMAKAAEEREDIESYRGLASLAKKQDPTSVLGPYYSGVYAEKTENKSKAIKHYEEALELNEEGHINYDFIVAKIEVLENLIFEEEEKELAEKEAKRAEKEAKKEEERKQKELDKQKKEEDKELKKLEKEIKKIEEEEAKAKKKKEEEQKKKEEEKKEENEKNGGDDN